MSDIQRQNVFFSGRVQGVGFRYTTLQVAKEYEVSGYVRNLSDGRVQIEAEGKAGEIKAFVATVQERMHGFIKKTEQKTTPATGEFQGFLIK